MNDIELTQLFIDYATCKKALLILDACIQAEILQRAETVKIAGVTASYFKASTGTPQYEQAARAAMPSDFDLLAYSSISTTVSWKTVCEVLGIKAPAGEEKPAKVVIK